MLLLSNKYQTLRIIQGSIFDPTVDPPQIDTIQELVPEIISVERVDEED